MTSRRQLAHRTGSGWYRLQPIDVPRPATGRATADVQCATCRSPVRLTIDGPAQWRVGRRLRFLAACGLIVGTAVVCSGAAAGTYAVGTDGVAGKVMLIAGLLILAPAAVLALIIAGYAVQDALRYDGIRLVPPAGAHSLRPAGDTRDPEPPASTYDINV
jgi:hypothetical protein